MIDGHIVFSGEFTDGDGEVSIGQHTYAIYVGAKETNHWIELKLNGGPHIVWIPDDQSHTHKYIHIPGDYTSFEVLTASSTIALYAIG